MGNHPSAHQPLERATSHAGNGLRLSVRRRCVAFYANCDVGCWMIACPVSAIETDDMRLQYCSRMSHSRLEPPIFRSISRFFSFRPAKRRLCSAHKYGIIQKRESCTDTDKRRAELRSSRFTHEAHRAFSAVEAEL